MQTITTFLVMHNNEIINVSHRNNCEHIINGASSTLVYEGIALTKTTKQLNAWIGDMLEVTDFYGTVLFKAPVVAKLVQHWDMEQPIGQREVYRKESKHWSLCFKQYIAQKK